MKGLAMRDLQYTHWVHAHDIHALAGVNMNMNMNVIENVNGHSWLLYHTVVRESFIGANNEQISCS